MTKDAAVLALRKHIRHLPISVNQESGHSRYGFSASGFCKVAIQTWTSVASSEASLGKICTRTYSSGFSLTVDWWPPSTPSGGPQARGISPPDHWFNQSQQERVIYVRYVHSPRHPNRKAEILPPLLYLTENQVTREGDYSKSWTQGDEIVRTILRVICHDVQHLLMLKMMVISWWGGMLYWDDLMYYKVKYTLWEAKGKRKSTEQNYISHDINFWNQLFRPKWHIAKITVKKPLSHPSIKYSVTCFVYFCVAYHLKL